MTGDLTIMFIVGFIIFALYLVGLVTMISKAHKQQRSELENDPELQGFDWEYYNTNYEVKPQSKKEEPIKERQRFETKRESNRTGSNWS